MAMRWQGKKKILFFFPQISWFLCVTKSGLVHRCAGGFLANGPEQQQQSKTWNCPYTVTRDTQVT